MSMELTDSRKAEISVGGGLLWQSKELDDDNDCSNCLRQVWQKRVLVLL